MLNRLSSTLTILFIVAFSINAWGQHPTLAHKLPPDGAVFYAEADLQRILTGTANFTNFAGEDVGPRMIYQVRQLYEQLCKMSRRHQFNPRLFEQISKAKAYFVIIPADKPRVRTSEYKVPKWDHETGKHIEGEFEKHIEKHVQPYVFSLLLELPSAASCANFLQQFKMLLNREKEKHADSRHFDWKQLDVEQGELIELPPRLLRLEKRRIPSETIEGLEEGFSPHNNKCPPHSPRPNQIVTSTGPAESTIADSSVTDFWGQKTTLGRLGRYLVFSGGKPGKLWKYLMSSPADALAGSPAYRRLTSTDNRPLVLATINLSPLIKLYEKQFEDKVKKAKKEYEKTGDEQRYNPAEWRLKAAQTQLKTFQVVKQLFSLDKCNQLGGGIFLEIQNDRARANVRILLSHDPGISPPLKQLLDGSGTFDPPKIGSIKAAAFMTRLDPAKLYKITVEKLRQIIPEEMETYEQQMGQSQAVMGIRPDESFKFMGPDQYLLVDVKEKEVERRRWSFPENPGNNEEPTYKTYKEKIVTTDITWLLGLESPQGFKDLLNKAFTSLSANKGMSGFAGKRSYQNTDIFCFGPEMGKEDKYPDGEMGLAFVVANRYFSVGSWEKVTRLIRRLQASSAGCDPRISSLINKHPRANFLATIPPEFFHKIWQHREKLGEGKDPLDIFFSGQPEDPELKKIWTQLRKTALDMQTHLLALDINKTTAIGSHTQNFYTINGELLLRKSQ
ncbi:MAG: hypothetical protein ACLFWL_11020 [Candidatus Brocadiia bacterium]